MTRQQFITGGIATSLFSSLPAYAKRSASKKKPEIFILIHGAWLGAFIYKRLAALLRSDGHVVYTPTLSGLAEHSHQINPDINLTTHIQDVSSLIEYEDITNVIIIAHSYAGMVLAGVLDRLPDRISHAIHLDSFLPENGKSLTDYVPHTANDGERPTKLKPFTDAKGFGITDPDQIQWLDKRLTDQPAKTFTEPVTMTGKDSQVRKSFIQLSEAPWFVEAADRARKNGYGYYDMKTAGHCAMVSMPNELAKAIYTVIRE